MDRNHNLKHKYNPKIELKIKYLFYLLMFVCISKFHLNNLIPQNPPIKLILCLAILISIIIIIYFDRFNLNYINFSIIISGISIITKNGELIYTFIILLALKEFEPKDIFKSYLVINLFYFIITIVLNKAGILESKLYYTSNMVVRDDLGFGNPNRAFLSFYLIWISYLYIKFETYNIKDRIILIVSAIIMYSITYSRTAFITIVLTMIIVEIIRIVDIKKNHIIIALIPTIIVSITLFIGYRMNNSIIMNEILSKRPQLWHLFLNNDIYKINLFGYDNNIIEYMSQGSKLALDNSYIYILFKNGLVIFLMIIGVYTLMLYMYGKHNKKKEVIIITSILIYSFGESILTDVSTNITLIYIYIVLSSIKFKNLYKKI